MRNLNYFFFMMLCLPVASCQHKSESEIQPISIDTTDVYVSTMEKGCYYTFFKPQIAWVGDVMPFYNSQTDVFHIFYLQDWRPASGIIHPIWSVQTKDFATYQTNQEAIPVGKSYEQDIAIGTGSFIQSNDGLYHGFYTGEMAENQNARQAVMKATSTDLSTWTKDKQFGYMPASDGYDRAEFRDPMVFYDAEAQIYRMSVTTHFWGSNALAHYTSNNLHDWTPAPQPLMKDAPHFMECSDIFKMGKFWYAIYSGIQAPRYVYFRYKEGSLDNPDGWSDPQPLDGRNYYAAKSTVNNEGRRFLCGWCQTFAGTHDASDWGGALVVHELVQRGEDPTLFCIPVKAVVDKYNIPVTLQEKKRQNAKISDKTYTLTALDNRAFVQYNRLHSPMKITCTIKQMQPTAIFGFSFAASSDKNKASHLRFIIEPDNNKADLAYDNDEVGQRNLLNIWRIREDKEFRITILIEKSVAVMYVNDKIAFSCRIYDMENNPWQIFCESGEVQLTNVQIYTYE